MGCDGGTIPRRDELVKTKKKTEERDREADQSAKWQHCALSCTKLRTPIVACELGQLYNKDAVIEFLLNRETFTVDVAAHIRSLKDVKELVLTEKNDFVEKTGNGGEYVDSQSSRFICPVVGLDMSGKYRFCYLRNCGCVLSERALKEVKSESCHKCNWEFDEKEDIVVINGTPEEIDALRLKMEERRAKVKSDRKNGKKRKATASTSTAVESVSQAEGDEMEQKPCSSKSSAAKILANIKLTKTTKASTDALLSKKVKTAYSVANDPNASETLKSIFTSHESAKNRPQGPWVTYNPLYF